ncbi:hypothetical protein [Nitratireductor thuwali]|uniref:Uncharacterized protein n=1 Tax=Nitratireductor thuwali TaxID=2267699 RepID=A0ABY5MLD9_9HYPH|nr:hypothetical protein NTH_01153 [Nitratireductor thuwali]
MVNTSTNKVPPALKQALQEFLQRRRSDRPVSIADMMQRTRYALPDLALTDDELERAIAEEIVDRHGNIAFDRHDTSHLRPSKN